jgi:hypothetical protein
MSLMREPSTPAQRWKWWEDAVEGRNPPVHDDDPQAGFFAVRKFRYGEWVKGPFVPARVWWEDGEIDPETGELLSDERLCAEWEWLKAMSPLLPTKIPPRRR